MQQQSAIRWTNKQMNEWANTHFPIAINRFQVAERAQRRSAAKVAEEIVAISVGAWWPSNKNEIS